MRTLPKEVVKRTLFLLMVLGFVAGATAVMVALRPMANFHWYAFYPEGRQVIKSAGFFILEERTTGNGVELPINLVLRPPPMLQKGGIGTNSSGFHEGGLAYIVQRNGAGAIECHGRRSDGNLVLIEIRAPAQQRSQVLDLRDAFRKAYPGLPIRLKFQ